mgnify:CR=1 FL=1
MIEFGQRKYIGFNWEGLDVIVTSSKVGYDNIIKKMGIYVMKLDTFNAFVFHASQLHYQYCGCFSLTCDSSLMTYDSSY